MDQQQFVMMERLKVRTERPKDAPVTLGRQKCGVSSFCVLERALGTGGTWKSSCGRGKKRTDRDCVHFTAQERVNGGLGRHLLQRG